MAAMLQMGNVYTPLSPFWEVRFIDLVMVILLLGIGTLVMRRNQ